MLKKTFFHEISLKNRYFHADYLENRLTGSSWSVLIKSEFLITTGPEWPSSSDLW